LSRTIVYGKDKVDKDLAKIENMSKKQDENKNEGTHDNNNVLLVFFNCTVICPKTKKESSYEQLLLYYDNIGIAHTNIILASVCVGNAYATRGIL